jgi:hypothetical protein
MLWGKGGTFSGQSVLEVVVVSFSSMRNVEGGYVLYSSRHSICLTTVLLRQMGWKKKRGSFE